MGSIQRSLQSCSDRAGREVKYCLWFPSALGAGAVSWVVVALDKTHPLGADAASSLTLLSCAVVGIPRTHPARAKACHPAGQAGIQGQHCPISAQEPSTSPRQGSGTAGCTDTPTQSLWFTVLSRDFPHSPRQQVGAGGRRGCPACQSAPLSFVSALALLEAG